VVRSGGLLAGSSVSMGSHPIFGKRRSFPRLPRRSSLSWTHRVVGAQIRPASPLSFVGSRFVTRSSVPKELDDDVIHAAWQVAVFAATTVMRFKLTDGHDLRRWRQPLHLPPQVVFYVYTSLNLPLAGVGAASPACRHSSAPRAPANDRVLRVRLHLGKLHTSFLVA
jgi:hypothetical protein